MQKNKLILKLFPLLITGLFMLSGCSVKSEKAKLEFGLKTGETYNIQITKEIKNYEESNGVLSDVNQLLVTAYSFQPKEITPDGLVKMDGKILSIKVQQEGPLGLIEYDSAVDTLQIPLLARPYASLVGKTFIMNVMKDGTVKNVEGMKANIDSAISSFDVPEEKITNYLAETLTGQFSDEVILENFERLLAFYPPNPVGIGESWNKDVKLTGDVPLILNNTYQLKERNNGVAILQIDSKISTDTTALLAEPQRFNRQILEGSQTGKMQVDEITGWISRAVFNYQIHEVKPDLSADGPTAIFFSSKKAPELADTKDNAGGSHLISSEIKVKYEPLITDAFREITFNPTAVVKGDGLGMTLTGMLVVFSSLILLFIVFVNMKKMLSIFDKKKTEPSKTTEEKKTEDDKLTGEVNAAIAAALHFYFQEIHDEESTVLTINRVSRTYSPWSSKIYGLRQNPR